MFTLIFSALAYISPIMAQPSVEPDSISVSSNNPIDEAEMLRSQYRQMMKQKNRVGTKAADFRFVTRDGKEKSLHNIISERDMVVVFYDPDCDDCHAAIDSISKGNLAERFDIVAIDSEEDRDRWEETAHTLPQNWTVGFATDPIQEEETYYIMTMPTIYLLDKNKTVLLKDTTIEDILNFHK